ncbi:MAG: sodium/proline symporter PutP [Clostridia bacterium]|nr:sodium/proline symporter PutP [Clostridia bacterium]
MTDILIIATIVVYMIFMLTIGAVLSKKNKSTDDYYLGGRRLGPFVTAMSAEASDMSSWLLMGLPGVALATGLADAFWTAVGLAVGTYLNWLIVARRLRIYTELNNSATIPAFFSNRFKDKSGLILAISAIVIIVFFVPYTGSGFAAIAKLFNSLFGVDYHVALVVGALVVVFYTALGGFLAASTTDFVQSIVMTIALIVVVVFGLKTSSGIDTVVNNVKDLPGYLSLTAMYDSATNASTDYGFIKIASMLAWGLGYFGMPHVLLRFMAINDEKKLKLSRRIAAVWVVISMAVAIFIGVVGYTFVKVKGIDLADSERIIIEISRVLGDTNWLGAITAGLIVSGILAATMSTADSQLLAAASSMSENLVHRFIAKNMSEKTSMLVARATVLVISLVSLVFAWNPGSKVFDIVSFAWAGFGAAFGPVMLCALFWKRTTKWGAFAGMFTGGVTAIVWCYVLKPFGALHGITVLNIYELLPAFIVGLVTIIVVSLLTKAPDKDITDEFDKVNELMKA